MSDKSKKNINILLGIVIVILILIIILLLVFGGKDSNLTPSGNIDIFDINCEKNCDCDDDSVFDEDDFEDNFDVEDEKGISWKSSNELNIFANPMYEMREKIAPESTNFYQFIVRNNTIYDVNYSIDFEENNEMKINMKYRLIKNDEYVVGSEEKWVTYEELSLENIYLSTKKSDTYYLEWKWFSSDNDTLIGEADNVNYSLKINIKAEQVV